MSSLDLSKLQNVRHKGDKTIARCPACAQEGMDESGEHLIIQPDGRFGCVVNSGAAGEAHRKIIFSLVGQPDTLPQHPKHHTNGHKDHWKPLPFAEDDAPPCTGYHYEYGMPSMGPWVYHTTEGKIAFYFCRYDPEGKKKEYWPWSRCEHTTGKRDWKPKLPPGKLPLYQVHLLKSHTGRVILVEGEKTVAAVQAMFHDDLVMTWQGGADNVGKSDWEPLVKFGGEIISVPDNDTRGRKASQDIALILPSLKVVQLPPGLPEGWDLADEIPEGMDVQALIAGALPNDPMSGFPIRTVESILAAVIPKNHYALADGMLGRNELLVVDGQGGTHKSRLIVHLACCGAAERDKWFSLALRHGCKRWLFIGSENSEARLQFDLSHLLPHFTPAEQASIKPNIIWYESTDDELCKGGFINVPACYPRLEALAKAFKPDVIVFDTLVSVTADVNLNDDKDMRDCVAATMKLTRSVSSDCRLIVIHHARPGTQNIAESLNRMSAGGFARNSKALINLCRAEINVFPGDAEDFTRIVIQGGKCNNGIPFPPMGIKFTENLGFIPDPDFNADEFREKVGLKAKDCKFSVEDALSIIEDKMLKLSEIVKIAKSGGGKLSDKTVQRALDKGKEDGRIICPRYGAYAAKGYLVQSLYRD